MPDFEQMHQQLGSMIEDAQADQDHDSANRTFAAAEQLGRQIIDAHPNDAEACYAIALTWYHRWLPQSECRNCVQWFHRTAELAPDHPWGPLYLGYQYFDDEEYDDAFAQFSRVDRDYFASIEHHWRNIKTRELMLCCRIHGAFPTVDCDSLKELVSDYIAAEIVDCPIPSEIIKTLSAAECRDRFDAAPCVVAKEMCRLIEGIGDQEVFPEQLAAFQAAAQTAV